MLPDIATVEIASIVLTGAMAIFLAWTWYANQLSNALIWWAGAYALAAAGTLLVFHDRGSWMSAGLLLYDLLHISAAFALWFGFRAFNGHPVRLPALVIVCVLYALAAEALIALTGYSHRAFIDAALIIVIGLSLMSIGEVVVGQKGGVSWRTLASAILIGHCVALGVRILIDIEGPIPGGLSSEYALRTALVIEPLVLPVLLGYILLALVFERRNADTASIAERDALTGLLNRRGLKTWLDSGRHNPPLAVVAFDLDHFKSVNDTHGHAVGDGVLQEVAERINNQIRAGDAFARIGGEEFVVLMPATGTQGAMSLAERMRMSLEESRLQVGDVPVAITGSFGVFVTNMFSGELVEAALTAADEALYAAKRSGRNRVELAEDRALA